MKSETHQAINRALCGEILELRSNGSLTELQLIDDMRADSTGLVHGGFVFGAADYAAMLAVNHPNVVLGSAEVRFMKPCRVGETLRFEARVDTGEGRKRKASVVARNAAGEEVFSGTFVCFVMERHVLGIEAV